MLFRYPAGSICGSGAFGRGIWGIIGEVIVIEFDMREKEEWAGDLIEDWEDAMDWPSVILEVVWEEPEPFDLREKTPMMCVVVVLSTLS